MFCGVHLFYTVYRITNLINNKTYIGKHQTEDLDDDYLGSGRLITRAIQKYGRVNFKKEILFVFDNEAEMNAKEAELVVVSEETYNLCPGGKGGFGYINASGKNVYPGIVENYKIASAKGRAKIQKLWRDPEYRKAHRPLVSATLKKYFSENDHHWLGRNHTEETKRKLSESFTKIGHQQGKKNSQYGTCWVTKDGLNYKIKLDEVTSYLQMGYIRGRTI